MIDQISKYNFRASETQVPPEVTDDLAASENGPGLWRMLYDRMVGSLAARDESVSAEELSEEGPARVSSRP